MGRLLGVGLGLDPLGSGPLGSDLLAKGMLVVGGFGFGSKRRR